MNGEERKYSYKRLICEIIDVVCLNVSFRFSENAKLLFLSLFDARYFPMYRTSFPEKAFLCLKENYGAFLDSVKRPERKADHSPPNSVEVKNG
jgi:hypothetical protein